MCKLWFGRCTSTCTPQRHPFDATRTTESDRGREAEREGEGVGGGSSAHGGYALLKFVVRLSWIHIVPTRILSYTHTHAIVRYDYDYTRHAQWVERSMALDEILWLQMHGMHWDAHRPLRQQRNSIYFSFYREEFVACSTLSLSLNALPLLLLVRQSPPPLLPFDIKSRQNSELYMKHTLVARRQWISACAHCSPRQW